MRVLVVSEGKHEQSGALENLVKRLGGDRADLTFDRVSNSDIHAFHGKGGGYFKRAVRWLMEAEKRDVEAMILLIDEDGQKERRTQLENAQGCSLSRLARAMGVAIRSFDAWMLADEQALASALGQRIDRQPDPETIRDPKGVCSGLLADGPNQMTQREMYAEVARRIDIDLLTSRCPMGFGLFAKNVRQVFVQEE